jgi:hypothetical protein
MTAVVLAAVPRAVLVLPPMMMMIVKVHPRALPKRRVTTMMDAQQGLLLLGVGELWLLDLVVSLVSTWYKMCQCVRFVYFT